MPLASLLEWLAVPLWMLLCGAIIAALFMLVGLIVHWLTRPRRR